MRKMLVLIALISLLLSLSISVFAETDTYYLRELDVEVDIPSDYMVVTRDTPENSPVFNELGMTKAETMEVFEERNIYLYAISNQYREEVVIDMVEDDTDNYNLYSDSEMLDWAEDWVDLFQQLGYLLYKYDVYHHDQAKFIKLYYTDTDQTQHNLEYFTVYDNKHISITFTSYEGSLLSRQETAIKTIVDNIQFVPAALREETEPFVYTDQKNGLTFTVPANWQQDQFFETTEGLDVGFHSVRNSGDMIMYGSIDVWDTMTPLEKTGITRADVNNTFLTRDLAAIFCGTTTDKVSTVYFNGVEYYSGEANMDVDLYGITIPVKMTSVIRIDNGWLYMFRFGGTSEDELYTDFVSLIKSAKYPNPAPVTQSNPADKTPEESNPVHIIAVVAVVAVAAVVVIVVIVVFRKKKVKKHEETLDYCISVPQLERKEEGCVACKNCGFALPTDSVFCPMCGSKVEKE